MNAIARALMLVRKVHDDLGTAELARRSGVPYTTLRDAAARGFAGPAVETLEKLTIAVEAAAEAVAGAHGKPSLPAPPTPAPTSGHPEKPAQIPAVGGGA